jgi:opacity protein-like surface antigen
MEPMKKFAAAALAGLALASTPSYAADLFGTAAPPMSAPADNPAVEIGSNWYIRGDVGATFDNAATVSFSSISTPPQGNANTPLSPNIGSSKFDHDFTVDVAVGYRVNNYLRFEGEYNYRTGPGGQNSTTVICPYGAYGETSQIPNAQNVLVEYGYLYNPSNTCNGLLNIQQQNNMFLADAFVDLGTYWGITPYVGGGVGANLSTLSGHLAYNETANGQPYAANLSPSGTFPQLWVDSTGLALPQQPKIAFTPQNWNRSINSTRWSMAFDLMAGVGIQLTPSATLDIGYRYLNTGAYNYLVNPQTGATIRETNISQQVRVGVRYMLN